jgi:hypothetical protein
MSFVLNEKNNLYIDQIFRNLASAELTFLIMLQRKNAATVHILFYIVTFMKLNQLLKYAYRIYTTQASYTVFTPHCFKILIVSVFGSFYDSSQPGIFPDYSARFVW